VDSIRLNEPFPEIQISLRRGDPKITLALQQAAADQEFAVQRITPGG
jgi:hypothetical protein